MTAYASNEPPAGQAAVRKAFGIRQLRAARAKGGRLTMLTCYDASFATVSCEAGVDMLLVGDSLGMVIQGHTSTLPVSLDDICYHTACVARAAPSSMIIADMPFASYQASAEQAFQNAALLMQAGAQMVKLEGGAWLAPTVSFLTQRGIPVCAHLGLTPQSVYALGGYMVQGRGAAGEALVADARLLEKAGADIVLVELIPSPLAAQLTAALTVPTIGIGAGPHVTGQVLVVYDILNLTPGRKARFVKNYLSQTSDIQAAIALFVSEVNSGAYPGPEHGFES
ncbi:MAG: 3-methyl-2-oxobutanoate hydroxymethyltransferase [Proteobacteria bacterium]|nr:3-methyl-2-oxobutanoate hydroxymethyltransferase [Pseudomonadota bacterium]